jgi:hypothetical protein
MIRGPTVTTVASSVKGRRDATVTTYAGLSQSLHSRCG